MLDPKMIRDAPDKIRKMITDRAVKFDFDKMLELDKKRRGLIQETDDLKARCVLCNTSFRLPNPLSFERCAVLDTISYL